MKFVNCAIVINESHLTICNRVSPRLHRWCAIRIGLFFLLCGLRLWRERLPLLRIAAATLLYWYVALNLPDWSAVIELYNAAH